MRYTVEKRERKATIYSGSCQEIVDRGLIQGAIGVLCDSADTIFVPNPDDFQPFLTDVPDYLPVQLVEELETVDGQLISAPGGVISDNDTFNKLTPTFTVAINVPEEFFEDNPIDSSLSYFTWSEGFKAGGFEIKGLKMIKFDQEEVTNYEFGWKMDAFEERFRFNTAIFAMKCGN